MTIKELASFTARTERTVRRWINKAELSSDTLSAKMSDAMKTNKPSDYTLEETEQILRCSSLPKIVVDELMINASNKATVLSTNNNDNINMMMSFMVKMQEQQQEFMKTVLTEIRQPMMNSPAQLALPEAPTLEPREYLNQLVRKHAKINNLKHWDSWNELYEQILYRCKTNIRVKADNEGISKISYLERENMLLVSCSIMKELIG